MYLNSWYHDPPLWRRWAKWRWPSFWFRVTQDLIASDTTLIFIDARRYEIFSLLIQQGYVPDLYTKFSMCVRITHSCRLGNIGMAGQTNQWRRIKQHCSKLSTPFFNQRSEGIAQTDTKFTQSSVRYLRLHFSLCPLLLKAQSTNLWVPALLVCPLLIALRGLIDFFQVQYQESLMPDFP